MLAELQEQKRPLGFTILAIFDFIGVFLWFVGLAAIDDILLLLGLPKALVLIISVIGVIFAIFSLVVGLAIWFGWKWYWYLSIIGQIINLVYSLINHPWNTPSIDGFGLMSAANMFSTTIVTWLFGLGWSVLLLWYWYTRRWWFKVGV